MPNNQHGKFKSVGDFAAKFTNLFKGPYSVPPSLDSVFLEKIRLSVTFSNSCAV